MQKNKLNVSVVLSDNSMTIFANQLIDNRPVNIFNKKELLTNFKVAKEFVVDSIRKIEIITETTIESINLIFDDYSIKSNILKNSTKIIEETIQFKTQTSLSNMHYLELYNSVLKSNQDLSDLKLISIIPFRFSIENEISNSKIYSKFPFRKKTDWIKCFFTLRYISRNFYEKTMELFDFQNIVFENVILLSQISSYKFNGFISDNLTFTLDIQKKETILSTNINQITIAVDKLNYSLNDLIIKIKNKYQINNEEVKNIIYTYNSLSIKEEVINDEIIFATGENELKVTKKDINDTIKSFIKTISSNAREVIKSKTNSFSIDFDLNIVGRLEHIKNIDIYCANHIGIKNVIANNKDQNSFYNWNKSFTIERALSKFIKIKNSKTNDDLMKRPKQSSLLFFNKKYYSLKKKTMNLSLI